MYINTTNDAMEVHCIHIYGPEILHFDAIFVKLCPLKISDTTPPTNEELFQPNPISHLTFTNKFTNLVEFDTNETNDDGRRGRDGGNDLSSNQLALSTTKETHRCSSKQRNMTSISTTPPLISINISTRDAPDSSFYRIPDYTGFAFQILELCCEVIRGRFQFYYENRMKSDQTKNIDWLEK